MDNDSGKRLEQTQHEPMGLVSGVFRGSQLIAPTVDKEGCATVAMLQRLDFYATRCLDLPRSSGPGAYFKSGGLPLSSDKGTISKAVALAHVPWSNRFKIVYIPCPYL